MYTYYTSLDPKRMEKRILACDLKNNFKHVNQSTVLNLHWEKGQVYVWGRKSIVILITCNLHLYYSVYAPFILFYHEKMNVL